MRSKSLLVGNILATIYIGTIVFIFAGTIIQYGGDYIIAAAAIFRVIFALVGIYSPAETVLTVIFVLLCIHVATFVLGWLFGWIAFAAKKSGLAKFSATLYLIGTICFPINLIFTLPLIILGYVGGSKQKELNKTAAAAA